MTVKKPTPPPPAKKLPVKSTPKLPLPTGKGVQPTSKPYGGKTPPVVKKT